MNTLLTLIATSVGGTSLISILVWLLIFGIIVYAVFLGSRHDTIASANQNYHHSPCRCRHGDLVAY